MANLHRLVNDSIIALLKGGEGSGNWGHAGRVGLVGGSLPRGESSTGAKESTDSDSSVSEAQPEAYHIDPISTGKELFDRIKRDGGFTYQPAMANSPTKGFAVSIYPEFEKVVPIDELTPEHVEEYIRQHAELLESDLRAHLGGWFDTEAGRVYLDVSVVVDTGEEAAELCRTHGQEGYYDLEQGETVIVKDEADRRKAQAGVGSVRRIVWSYGRRAAPDGGGIRQQYPPAVRPAAPARRETEEVTGPALEKGGAGSGNWDHAGRIGLVGGSAPSGSSGDGGATGSRERHIREKATEIAHLDRERGYLFDDDGTVLATFEGDEVCVQIPPESLSKLAGKTFIHNHPSGRTFSPADIAMAIRSKVKEMRAIGQEYEYIMRFDGLTEENYLWARTQWEHMQAKILDEYKDKLRLGEVTPREANVAMAEELARRFQDETGAVYERRERVDNAAD